MISRWKKKPQKPSFSRALSLKLQIFELKVENFHHQILKNSVFTVLSFYDYGKVTAKPRYSLGSNVQSKKLVVLEEGCIIMDGITVVSVIKRKFQESGSPMKIPMQRGGTFSAELTPEGIRVDNLGNQSILPWIVFQEAICVLIRNGGRVRRGDAMNAQLGEPDLSLDSIEGHIAHVVYGKKIGDSVFRRITPIAAILVWAGICEAAPGELILL